MRSRAWLGLAAMVLLAGACGSDSAESSIVAEVASYDLAVGEDERFLVGVFGEGLNFLSWGEVELELTHEGEVQSTHTAQFLPIPAHGPATVEPGEGPQLTRPSEGRGVYEARGVALAEPGIWEVTVTAEVDGKTESASAAFTVAEEHAVVTPGELVPRTVNPLPGDASVGAQAIDSRADAQGVVPDPLLHSTTVAENLDSGRVTVVLVSTPVFCVSRFCGPITDAVEELAVDLGDEVGFVHLEVWEDFESNQLNDSALEWIWPGQQGDPAEPWVFLIGADGRLVQRWDNVLDLEGLKAAIAAETEPR